MKLEAEKRPTEEAERREALPEGVKKLLEEGKRRGSLSMEEVTEGLPDDLDAEQIEGILEVFQSEGIEVVDALRPARTRRTERRLPSGPPAREARRSLPRTPGRKAWLWTTPSGCTSRRSGASIC